MSLDDLPEDSKLCQHAIIVLGLACAAAYGNDVVADQMIDAEMDAYIKKWGAFPPLSERVAAVKDLLRRAVRIIDEKEGAK